jgi:hypothetical protein
MSFATRRLDWPPWGSQERAPAADYWPAEEAQYLYAATLDWETYDDTRRRNVEDALWQGFERLVQSRGFADETAWDAARWHPVRLFYDVFQARARWHRFTVRWEFATRRIWEPVFARYIEQVERVSIACVGPVWFVRRWDVPGNTAHARRAREAHERSPEEKDQHEWPALP